MAIDERKDDPQVRGARLHAEAKYYHVDYNMI